MANKVTVFEILNSKAGYLNSPLEAQILLCTVLKRNREHLIAHPEHVITKSQERKFNSLCLIRAKGVPLSYITGHKQFYGLDFIVDKNVLIPRPETEMLVDDAILLASKIKNPIIFDVGTGSGCIAIAIAKKNINAKIFASDISHGALGVAKKNILMHKVSKRVKLLRGDLLLPFGEYTADVIVANLPYIPFVEKKFVEKEVREYEPATALWGGKDGMAFLNKLFIQIKGLKHKPKYVICEFGFSMKRNVKNSLKKYFPSSHVEFKKDLAGRDRTFILSFVS